jgi:hypothetical protein
MIVFQREAVNKYQGGMKDKIQLLYWRKKERMASEDQRQGQGEDRQHVRKS